MRRPQATIAVSPQLRLLSPLAAVIFDRRQVRARRGKKALMASDVASRLVAKDSAETITVVVRRLPEGVWLATSDDLPGLIVETDTREEAIDLSPELALDLLREEGRQPEKAHPRFVFVFP
jgi:predicted RNase H-like HicB family nuclease